MTSRPIILQCDKLSCDEESRMKRAVGTGDWVWGAGGQVDSLQQKPGFQYLEQKPTSSFGISSGAETFFAKKPKREF